MGFYKSTKRENALAFLTWSNFDTVPNSLTSPSTYNSASSPLVTPSFYTPVKLQFAHEAVPSELLLISSPLFLLPPLRFAFRQEVRQARLCRLRTNASSFSSRVFIVELSSSAPRQGTDVKMPPLRKSRHAMSAVFACCVSVVVA
ncbi:unnamed protein product [Rodentolepis nana]|uniref:Uncharacterized protein n=1 Tax=Rodentolepis nana TaxID=102285 RepID=A0A0R3TZ60_RODNA|nr:unnamed protein product [Rodentolepis nana]